MLWVLIHGHFLLKRLMETVLIILKAIILLSMNTLEDMFFYGLLNRVFLTCDLDLGRHEQIGYLNNFLSSIPLGHCCAKNEYSGSNNDQTSSVTSSSS